MPTAISNSEKNNVSQRAKENLKDVEYIKKGLKEEGYTEKRAKMLFRQASIYQDKYPTRGNANVIKATTEFLKTL